VLLSIRECVTIHVEQMHKKKEENRNLKKEFSENLRLVVNFTKINDK
jgi:hypothetical protein